MNRCDLSFSRRALAPALLALAAALAALPPAVHAQAEITPGVRAFPATALRGTLQVISPPDVRLDGQPARLSPGSRIRNPQNNLVLSGAVIGQELVVNYTRDASGLVHEVWILSDAEIAKKRATATPARNFLFGSEVRTTPVDDGKTPFNQLPVYGSPGAR